MGMSEGTGKLAEQHLSYLTSVVKFTEKETQYLNSRIVTEDDQTGLKGPASFIEELPAINDKR